MTHSTDTPLCAQVIYSLFVRNHTSEGTFSAVEKDLDRIKALGTDIIWLLPIHPVGLERRSGRDGSPYAIQDYRTVDPHMGTMDDFRHLADAIHKRGMKCLIDVVFNHTSPDSVLYHEHPDFFRRDKQGNPCSLVPEWADIIDLDYGNKELWCYQIDTLKQWAHSVDGFRCDCAYRTPIEFWKKAREAVAQVNPDAIWLAESADLPFIKFLRNQGVCAVSDSELYQVFDICYDYDIWSVFSKYLHGKIPISTYMGCLDMQMSLYPQSAVKLRCLENHDQDRIASYCKNEWSVKNWIAFSFLQKGTAMIYEGEEFQAAKRPSIFERDVVMHPKETDISDFIARCSYVKKKFLPIDAPVHIEGDDTQGLAHICYTTNQSSIKGTFCLGDLQKSYATDLPDGEYENLLTGQPVVVKDRRVDSADMPFVVRCKDR